MKLKLPETMNGEATKKKNNSTKAFTKSRSLLEKALVDYSKESSKPPTCLKINGENFGTMGDISLVIGKAKSKKTFLITLALAAAVCNHSISDVFDGKLPDGKKKVVYIDTEQARHRVIRVADRVLKLIGEEKRILENFDVYALRNYKTNERYSIIIQLINSTPDLGLLVIDGIRDLVTSINDEEQATKIASDLLKWTEERGIHIVTVLHQNKSDSNARGHLGTELVNKAEITVSVSEEKDDKNKSRVEASYCKDKPFETFAFQINESGLPEKALGWAPKRKSKPKNQRYSPNEVDKDKHKVILTELSENVSGKKPNHSEMTTQIKLSVTKNLESIGESKAKEYLSYYQNEGFIKKIGKDRSRKTYYEVQPLNESTEVG